ncbi:hypothetical protein TNIN_384991 [Trichonephila inaurata madagascariensis]|uniref:Uncharacterized protein n=1 Tax=Trichonephila inaurata madagascariensis TaxID=2747483 RepID=A0A8X7CGZ1_9ARAC|nr:hypothetical protein TNIN_384991 [Trichonephila inaurata madagascariensis]
MTRFFAALENQCKIIETALLSKCNMNQQMREEARQVLDELKSSNYRNFVMIKSEKFVEACKESFLLCQRKRIAVWWRHLLLVNLTNRRERQHVVQS